MATEQQKLNLPNWLREVLESGQVTDPLPMKRSEPRRHWSGSCFAQPDCASGDERFLVHGFNISSAGIGFLSREPVSEGQILTLIPGDGSGAPVRVRVVHCTQTVGRYKVGAIIEEAQPLTKTE